jgi:hypothetical protein
MVIDQAIGVLDQPISIQVSAASDHVGHPAVVIFDLALSGHFQQVVRACHEL